MEVVVGTGPSCVVGAGLETANALTRSFASLMECRSGEELRRTCRCSSAAPVRRYSLAKANPYLLSSDGCWKTVDSFSAEENGV